MRRQLGESCYVLNLLHAVATQAGVLLMLLSFLFAALLTLAGTQRFKAFSLGREVAHG